MNTRNILKSAALAGSLAAALAAAPASAQEKPRFYVSGMVGYETPNDFDVDGGPITSDLSLESDWSFGAAVGMQALEAMRLELEYMVRNSSADALEDLAIEGVGGGVDARTLMLNAVFDLKVAPWLSPYVGVGAGWASVDIDSVDAGFLTLSGDDDVFAWQGMVGLSVPVSASVALFADVRYVRTNEVSFDIGPGALVQASGRFSTVSATAGVRVWF